ncbi:MAG: type II secretion system protein [Synergistaceae bacterium]|nr:type II secretion system protein [Synergistaceae bacterium]
MIYPPPPPYKKERASGFTLVEILIVLVIVGILAGTLILTAGAFIEKAEKTAFQANARTALSAIRLVIVEDGILGTANFNSLGFANITDSNNTLVMRICEAAGANTNLYTVTNVDIDRHGNVIFFVFKTKDQSKSIVYCNYITGNGNNITVHSGWEFLTWKDASKFTEAFRAKDPARHSGRPK